MRKQFLTYSFIAGSIIFLLGINPHYYGNDFNLFNHSQKSIFNHIDAHNHNNDYSTLWSNFYNDIIQNTLPLANYEESTKIIFNTFEPSTIKFYPEPINQRQMSLWLDLTLRKNSYRTDKGFKIGLKI